MSEQLYNIHEHNINVDTRELYIHGSILSEEDSGIDFRSSINLIKNINYLNHINNDPITIHLQALGGSWDDGMAIYDCITQSSSPCLIIGYSNVSSMSTVILQAANYRFIMPNGFLMIHEGSFHMGGVSKIVYSNVKKDMQDFTSMLNIYSEKTLLSDSFSKKNISSIYKFYEDKLNVERDWFISIDEAMKLNLIDDVYSLSKYKKILKKLKSG